VLPGPAHRPCVRAQQAMQWQVAGCEGGWVVSNRWAGGQQGRGRQGGTGGGEGRAHLEGDVLPDRRIRKRLARDKLHAERAVPPSNTLRCTEVRTCQVGVGGAARPHGWVGVGRKVAWVDRRARHS
jgi:hypothetical protein